MKDSNFTSKMRLSIQENSIMYRKSVCIVKKTPFLKGKTRRAKSVVKMCHFVMVDFNKDINIIKHNFLKRFCNVGLSGTVLYVASGSSSAHARNTPSNMRDPKNYHFNAQHSINFFYFIVIIVKSVQKNGITCFIRYMQSRDIAKTKCCDLVG